MSKLGSNWFQQIPDWVLYACIPTFGGMAIAYAGLKTATNEWIVLGIGFTVVGIILFPFKGYLLMVIWGAQISTAFFLKKSYLVKTYPKHLPMPEDKVIAKIVAQTRSGAVSAKDATGALQDLKKLYDQGVITAEEYEEKRKILLGMSKPVSNWFEQIPDWVLLPEDKAIAKIVAQTRTGAVSAKDATGALQDLKKLYDQGIITAEEYEEKRKILLAMSKPVSNWFEQIPDWVRYACIPTFGGMAIAYAGLKTATYEWIGLGLGFTVLGILLSSNGYLLVVIWGAQIGTAFFLKKSYLVKTYPKHLPMPEDKAIAKIVAQTRPKIDINTCSKNDLVNILGLPIVYANDIELLQNEGYIFTHSEELTEIIGIPEGTVRQLTGMIVFSYDFKQEVDFSWKRLNTLSAEELVVRGLEPEVAAKIVNERTKHGEYKTLLAIKKRTGIPYSSYKSLA